MGRQEQLARLDLLADEVARKGSRCVILAGKPGVGKSRLLREWGKQARRKGHLVLVCDMSQVPMAAVGPGLSSRLRTLLEVKRPIARRALHVALSGLGMATLIGVAVWVAGLRTLLVDVAGMDPWQIVASTFALAVITAVGAWVIEHRVDGAQEALLFRDAEDVRRDATAAGEALVRYSMRLRPRRRALAIVFDSWDTRNIRGDAAREEAKRLHGAFAQAALSSEGWRRRRDALLALFVSRTDDVELCTGHTQFEQIEPVDQAEVIELLRRPCEGTGGLAFSEDAARACVAYGGGVMEEVRACASYAWERARGAGLGGISVEESRRYGAQGVGERVAAAIGRLERDLPEIARALASGRVPEPLTALCVAEWARIAPQDIAADGGDGALDSAEGFLQACVTGGLLRRVERQGSTATRRSPLLYRFPHQLWQEKLRECLESASDAEQEWRDRLRARIVLAQTRSTDAHMRRAAVDDLLRLPPEMWSSDHVLALFQLAVDADPGTCGRARAVVSAVAQEWWFPDAIGTVSAACSSGGPLERGAAFLTAAYVPGALKDASLGDLLTVGLMDEDWFVRLGAALALRTAPGRFEDRVCREILIARLGDVHPEVRRVAAECVATVPESSRDVVWRDALLAHLGDELEAVSRTVAAALHAVPLRLRDKTYLDKLWPYLYARQPAVQNAVAEAMAALPDDLWDDDLHAALLRHLNEGESGVRATLDVLSALPERLRTTAHRDALLARLRSGDGAVRFAAARALVSTPPHQCDAAFRDRLVACLGDEEQVVRGAVLALKVVPEELRDQSYCAALVAMVERRDERVSRGAALALCTVPEPIRDQRYRDALLARIDAPEGNVRPAVLEALATVPECLRDETYRDALRVRLDDPDGYVRRAVAKALALMPERLRNGAYRDSLLERLDGPDGYVQTAVVEILTSVPDRLREEAYRRALLACLDDPDGCAQPGALYALGTVPEHLRDTTYREAIVSRVSGRNDDPDIWLALIEALRTVPEELRTEDYRDALMAGVDHDDEVVRRAVVGALGLVPDHLRNEAYSDALAESLCDGDEGVRGAAALVLHKAGVQPSSTALGNALVIMLGQWWTDEDAWRVGVELLLGRVRIDDTEQV